MPDTLPFTSYTIEQPEEQYHFNSDTVLLGLFARIRHSDTVLDIGCGSGALLLYAARQKPQGLTGIDLFPEVIKAAAENLFRNGVQAELAVTPVQAHTGCYDVILCNPPYFSTGKEELKNENRYLRAARHDENLPLPELLASVQKLLKENGRFYMVQRAQKLMHIIYTAETYGLYPSELRIVYDTAGGTAKSVLLCFTRSKKRELKIHPPAYLDEPESYPGKERQ